MACPTTSEFADYLAGDATHHAHVVSCARCGAIATALRLVPSVEDLDAVLAEAERRETIATAAVAELEAILPHRWGAHARSDERLQSPEGVRRLLQRAAENYGVTPRRALALAQVAVTCAASGTVAPILTFNALKDFATYSLRIADDLDSAFGALDIAERFVPFTDDPRHSAAVLAYARAYVAGDSTCAQWDRALHFLDDCEPVFEASDTRRWRATRHLRAAILLRGSEYGLAAGQYRELLTLESDPVLRARLMSDLAECYSRMGHADQALPLATNALEVLVNSSDPYAIAQTMWIRGTALSGVGNHDDAIQTLEAASRLFAMSGLNDDELGAELSLIQALLARDPATDVAPRLEQAYMLACALDASQPLRSCARRSTVWVALVAAYERKKLTRAVITHAAEYLRTIGRGDEAPFVSLQ